MKSSVAALLIQLLPAAATGQESRPAAPPPAAVLHTVGGISPAALAPAALPAGEPGLVVGGLLPDRHGSWAPWAELLPAGGWRLICLGRRELAAGPSLWRSLAAAGLTLVVANVRASSGGLPAVEVARLEAGGLRIAVLALADPAGGPPGPGLEIAGDALPALLERAREGADLVVVATDLDREAAAALLRRAPGADLWLASGRGTADAGLVAIGSGRLGAVPWGGARWGRTEIGPGGAAHAFRVPAGPAAPGALESRRRHGLVTRLCEELPDPDPEPAGPAAPGLGSGANRASRWTVRGVAERGGYGSWKPEAGRLLVADLEVENRLPLALARGLEIPTEYRLPAVGDHLYLIRGGRELLRLALPEEPPPGLLPGEELVLPRPGERRRGNLLFAAPPGGEAGLELRLYDFAHGHLRIPLAPSPPCPAPLVPLQRNEILEAGVFGLELLPAPAGSPAGMAAVALDLRARSLYVFPADATAFDPAAAKGAVLHVGTVADWRESRTYLRLVADGLYSFSPLAEGTTLPAEPRFLPDLMTGGRVLFPAPAARASLELRCDFPLASLPDREEPIRPGGFAFLLEGSLPAPALPKPLAALEDPPFRVAILGRERAGAWNGVRAGEGEVFLLLDVAVTVPGDRGELFQTAEQLKYVTEEGEEVLLAEESLGGRRPAAALLWVPPGATRRFLAAFRTPEGERRPRIAYAGASRAEVVALPPFPPKKAR